MGPVGAGCRSLTKRLAEGVFDGVFGEEVFTETPVSIGFGNSNYDCRVHNVNSLPFYKDRRRPLLLECNMVMVAYAVDSRRDFDSELQIIVRELKSVFGSSPPPMVLVATKTDIPEPRWQVSREEGKALADSLGCHFVETSAKEDKNVSLAFKAVLAEFLRPTFLKRVDDKVMPPNFPCAKLTLVGPADSGKSTLSRTLAQWSELTCCGTNRLPKSAVPSLHSLSRSAVGVDAYSELQISPKIRLRVFDFAGQLEYLPIHQV